MLKNIKIKSKILVGFLTIIVLIALNNSFTINTLNNIFNRVKYTKKFNTILMDIEHLNYHIIQIQQFLTDASATHEKDGLRKAKKHFQKAEKILNALLTSYHIGKQIRNSLLNLKKLLPIYFNTGIHMAKVYMDKGIKEGNKEMKNFDKIAEKTSLTLSQLVLSNETKMEKLERNIFNLIKKNRLVAIFSFCIILIFSLSLGIFISNLISNPIRNFIKDLKINKNNLAFSFKITTKDEIGELGTFFNEFIKNIHDFMVNIKLIVEKLGIFQVKNSKVSFLLNNTSNRLNKDAEVLSSSLSELNTSLNQISINSKDVKEESIALLDITKKMESSTNEVNSMMKVIKNKIDKSVESVKEIENITNNTTEQILKVGEKMKDVEIAGNNVKNEISNTINALKVISEEIENVSSAINQQAASIEEVAENSKNAENLSIDTLEKAKQGMESLEILYNAISETKNKILKVGKEINYLSGMAENIGKITDTINEISDQTNLLALNAAIEAARAGDAGKGFAVVADEVRKLAERSAQATKEIADLINSIREKVVSSNKFTNESIDRVEEGTKIAEATKKANEEIVKFSESTMTLISQISKAAKEQADVSNMIVNSIEEIKDKNQNNFDIAQKLDLSGKTIIKSVYETKESVKKIIKSSENQKESINNVDKIVNDIEDSAKKTEQCMHEQEKWIKKVSDGVDGINRFIEELSIAITQQKGISENLIKINLNLKDSNERNLHIVKDVELTEKELKSLIEKLLMETKGYRLSGDILSVELAIVQHERFLEKYKYEFVVNKNIDFEKVVDGKNCQFGKWYYSEGKKFFNLEEFKSIENPHLEIHEVIKQAVIYHNKGDMKKRDEMLNKAVELSRLIEKLLNNLKIKIKEKENNFPISV